MASVRLRKIEHTGVGAGKQKCKNKLDFYYGSLKKKIVIIRHSLKPNNLLFS